MKNHHKTICSVCGKLFSMSDLTSGRFVRALIADRNAAEHPDWNAEASIGSGDLNQYRSLYVQNVFEQERGEFSSLEKEVIDNGVNLKARLEIRHLHSKLDLLLTHQ